MEFLVRHVKIAAADRLEIDFSVNQPMVQTSEFVVSFAWKCEFGHQVDKVPFIPTKKAAMSRMVRYWDWLLYEFFSAYTYLSVGVSKYPNGLKISVAIMVDWNFMSSRTFVGARNLFRSTFFECLKPNVPKFSQRLAPVQIRLKNSWKFPGNNFVKTTRSTAQSPALFATLTFFLKAKWRPPAFNLFYC